MSLQRPERIEGCEVSARLVATLGLAQVLANLLYGIGWIEPLTLGASTGLFIAVALFAC